MLILVGEHDHIVPPEHRQAIAHALRAAGVRHEVVEYRSALHGFLSDRRETYQPEGANDAWRRIQELLSEELNRPHGARL
jgi:carboxymethylenebutenolidase